MPYIILLYVAFFSKASRRLPLLPDQTQMFSVEAASLRSFLLPSEAQRFLENCRQPGYPLPLPYSPRDMPSMNNTVSCKANIALNDAEGESSTQPGINKDRELEDGRGLTLHSSEKTCPAQTLQDSSDKKKKNFTDGVKGTYFESNAIQTKPDQTNKRSRLGTGDVNDAALDNNVCVMQCRIPGVASGLENVVKVEGNKQQKWCRVPKYLFKSTAKVVTISVFLYLLYMNNHK